MTLKPSDGQSVLQEEGEDPGLVPPRVVAAARAAVAGAHLGPQEQWTVAAGADRAQLGHPLGRLVVGDTGIVEPGGDVQRRVVGRPRCCRTASSRACSVAYGSSRGSPHSSHSFAVSGRDGSLIVDTTSTNGTSATALANRSGRIVTHAPTSRPPALPPRIATRRGSAQPSAATCSTAASVSTNVLRLFSSLPSRYHRRPSSPPPRGCTSTQVDSPVEQRQPGDREPRRERRLVRAVARRRRTERSRRRRCRRGARRRRALRFRRPNGPRSASTRTSSRSTLGVGVCLRRIRSPVTTSWSYTVDGVVSDWYPRRSDVVSHSGLAPSSTSCGSVPKSSTSSVPSRNRTRTRGWASAHSCRIEVAGERLGRRDPAPGDVGEQLLPLARVVERCRHDAEVGGVEVGEHDEPVAPVVDRVLEVGRARAHGPRARPSDRRPGSATPPCSSCSPSR